MIRNRLVEPDCPRGQAAAPQCLVIAALHHLGDGDAQLLRQVLFLAAGQIEVAHRDQDLELRREELEDVVHSVLVVALAAAAFHDGVAAKLERQGSDLRGDQLAGHRGRHGIALVAGVCLDRLRQPEVGKFLLRVDDNRGDAKHFGLCDRRLHLVLPLPHVDGDREQVLDLVLLSRQDGAEG